MSFRDLLNKNKFGMGSGTGGPPPTAAPPNVPPVHAAAATSIPWRNAAEWARSVGSLSGRVLRFTNCELFLPDGTIKVEKGTGLCVRDGRIIDSVRFIALGAHARARHFRAAALAHSPLFPRPLLSLGCVFLLCGFNKLSAR